MLLGSSAGIIYNVSSFQRWRFQVSSLVMDNTSPTGSAQTSRLARPSLGRAGCGQKRFYHQGPCRSITSLICPQTRKCRITPPIGMTQLLAYTYTSNVQNLSLWHALEPKLWPLSGSSDGWTVRGRPLIQLSKHVLLDQHRLPYQHTRLYKQVLLCKLGILHNIYCF